MTFRRISLKFQQFYLTLPGEKPSFLSLSLTFVNIHEISLIFIKLQFFDLTAIDASFAVDFADTHVNRKVKNNWEYLNCFKFTQIT